MMEAKSVIVKGLPIGQQIFLDLIVPPLGTSLWWLLSWGWALTAQGGNISQRTKKWISKGFWIVLALTYVIMFSVTFF